MQINIRYSKFSTLKKKTSLDLLFLKKKKSYSSNNFLSLYTVLEHPEDTVYNIKYICFGNYKATFFFKKHMPINVNNKFPVFICKTEELCWHHWSRNYGTLIWEDKSNFLVHHEAILIHLWNNDLYDYLKREKKNPNGRYNCKRFIGFKLKGNTSLLNKASHFALGSHACVISNTTLLNNNKNNNNKNKSYIYVFIFYLYVRWAQ